MKTFKQFAEVKELDNATYFDNTLQQQSILLTRMKKKAEQIGDARLVQYIDKMIATIKHTWQTNNTSKLPQVVDYIKSSLKHIEDYLTQQSPGQQQQNQPAQQEESPWSQGGDKLARFPHLARAVRQLNRHSDVVEPLARMLQKNKRRFSDWEGQMMRGELDANGLKDKLVQHGYYKIHSYPRYND